MSTPTGETKGTHGGPRPNSGGAREGAGKPLQVQEPKPLSQEPKPVTKKDKPMLAHARKVLNTDPRFAHVTPLEALLLTMRHYLAEGDFSIAASIADKAAKYVHAPIAATKLHGANGEDVDMSESALKVIINNKNDKDQEPEARRAAG